MTIGGNTVNRAALKTAARRLVVSVGGLEAAATVCRLNKTALAAAYDPHQPERALPVDVVAELEHVAAAPVVTTVLARLSGHALVPIAPGGGLEALALVHVFRGAAEVGAAYAAAIADTRLSRAECKAVAGRLLELQAACMQAVAALLNDREGDHDDLD